MANYRTQIEVDAPIDRVFAYMADFANAADWDPGVARVDRLDAGPVRVGSRFDVVTTLFGAEAKLDYAVTQFDAPSRIVFEAETGTLRSVDTLSLEKTDRGTRLTYDAILILKGLGFVADPALHLAFQWIGGRAGRGLEEAVAAECAED